MDEPKPISKEADAVGLYIEHDRKIDKIKEEVSELLRNDLKLGQKLDQLAERINEGVSKTAYNTWVKVSEISTAMADMKHDNEKRDIKINGVQNMVEWFYRGIIFVFVAGVLLAVYKLK